MADTSATCLCLQTVAITTPTATACPGTACLPMATRVRSSQATHRPTRRNTKSAFTNDSSMPIPHMIHVHRNLSPEERRRSRIVAAIIVPNLIVIGLVIWYFAAHHHRRPPSIFDTPVDDVSAYLASKDFNSLSTKERLEY